MPLPLSELEITKPTRKSIFKLISELQTQGNIHVWIVDKRQLNETNSYLKWISEEELTRAQKFRFVKDFSTYVVARGILRTLLSKYSQIHSDTINFVYGAYGKPKLENNDTIQFNVSHSKELIVLAFTLGTEIGVDVEYVNNTINFMKITHTVFNKTEIEFLNSLEKKNQAYGFYHLWTRKEAFIKLSGYGLSMPIALTKISVLQNKAHLVDEKSNNENILNWDTKLKSFTPISGYSAAVTIQKNANKTEFMSWNDYEGTFQKE